MVEHGNGEECLAGRVRLCSASELASITDEAARQSWSARLDSLALSELDAQDLHVLVPFVRNGSEDGMPESHRCYLWFKHVGVNKRSCVVIDVSDHWISRLPRPSISQLNRVVFMLVEQLPIRFLDPFKRPMQRPSSDP